MMCLLLNATKFLPRPAGGATRGGEGPIPGRDGGAAQEGGRDRGRGRHRGRGTTRQVPGQGRRGSRRAQASDGVKSIYLVTCPENDQYFLQTHC